LCHKHHGFGWKYNSTYPPSQYLMNNFTGLGIRKRFHGRSKL
jgi:hypothetical protein